MPSSIKRFELLSLIALLIGFINSALMFNDFSQMAGGVFTLFVQGVSFFLLLALVLLISRKRSKIAKWIYVVMFAVGMIPSIPMLSSMLAMGMPGFLSVTTLVMQIIGLYFLFESTSAVYFEKQDAASGVVGAMKKPSQPLAAKVLIVFVPTLLVFGAATVFLLGTASDKELVSLRQPSGSFERKTEVIPAAQATPDPKVDYLALLDLPHSSAAKEGQPGVPATYRTHCSACHDSGVAGSPKPGSARLQGIPSDGYVQALYRVRNGYGAMPAADPSLTDGQLLAALRYMVIGQ